MAKSQKNKISEIIVQAKSAVSIGDIGRAVELLSGIAVEQIAGEFASSSQRVDSMLDLVILFRKIGSGDRAEVWCQRVLEFGSNGDAFNELGGIYFSQGRISESVATYKRAMEVEPGRFEFGANYVRAAMASGRVHETIGLLKEIVDAMPGNLQVHSNYLFALHQMASIDRQELFDEHKRWAKLYASTDLAKTKHDNDPCPDRKLKIGYISPDFRSHSVAYFFEPLLDGHDRQEVEVYGYGNVASPDYVTERLKSKFDHYRNVTGMEYKEIADAIADDKIDILIEMAGHIGESSLPVLAYKPAPVQVTYMGYPDTTGMEQIDYRVTDTLAEGEGSQQFYTEELVYLPEGFLCYRPLEFAPPVSELPAKTNGYITFGSFNAAGKINLPLIELWSQVLKSVKDSRLLLKIKGGDDDEVRKYYHESFERNGISSDRIEIIGWILKTDHLNIYSRVDIALDTYPYHGTTTTCEALWMGVPVISLVGEPHLSRVGLSLLNRVGLRSFAVSNPRDYVDKACQLAGELCELSKLRSTMRGRIAASGLCCGKNFASEFEAAYRTMWHKWCFGRNCNSKLPGNSFVNETCEAGK